MSKKDPKRTPKSKIKAALRQLFLRSRERGYTIKRDKYTCQKCGVKQSKAKGKEVSVQVHHLRGIRWNEMFEYIYQELLCCPELMITICSACHDKEHLTDKKK